jgi:hypothetical protein
LGGSTKVTRVSPMSAALFYRFVLSEFKGVLSSAWKV